MKLRHWIGCAILTALCVGFAESGAQAQLEVLPTVDRTRQEQDARFEEMLRRWEKTEAKLSELRLQIGASQGNPVDSSNQEIDRRLRALETHWDGDAKTAAQGGLEKVDIQTKPNHKLKGRLYFDHIMYDDPNKVILPGGRMNETGFNTARIGIGGNIYENVKYALEVEFEGTETDFKDVYIELQNLPFVNHVRVGHFKEPIGLEENTSSRHILFMGRTMGNGALVPGRNFGFEVWDHLNGNENVSWFMGSFRHDSDDSPTGSGMHRDDNGDWTYDARIAWNPIYDEPSGGRYLVHFGGAYSYRTDTTMVSFTGKPELGTQAGLINSTVAGDDNWSLFTGEAAIVWGPAVLQAEYYGADAGSGNDFTAVYAQAGYFLTGEHRGYKRSYKVFDRVKPIENFFSVRTGEGICTGTGAWLLKARYSHLELDKGTGGFRGTQNNFATGVNWYLNPYTVLKFDYVHENVERVAGAKGHANNIGMRFQVDW